jgi:hypothetical protein
MDPTGFYYLGARYYEPTSGRFLSADPMGQAASPSLYDFAGGDPVNFFDPTGRIFGTGLSPSEFAGAVVTGMGEGFQHNVIDPLGTGAGLLVYTNVPGTIKVGLGVGVAGYVSLSRNKSGTYTVEGGYGDGFGGTVEVSTTTSTNETITGNAVSFGYNVEAETHIGPATVSYGVDGNATFARNGKYAIDPITGEGSIVLAGTPLDIGGEGGPSITGNLMNSGDVKVDFDPEKVASGGFGTFIFVGVHVGYSWGGDGNAEQSENGINSSGNNSLGGNTNNRGSTVGNTTVQQDPTGKYTKPVSTY